MKSLDIYLKSLHEPEPKEEGEEEEERPPSWDVVPEACLLLYDGIERADAGEDQQERRDNEPGVVQTLGLGELHHPLESDQVQPDPVSSEPGDSGGGTG